MWTSSWIVIICCVFGIQLCSGYIAPVNGKITIDGTADNINLDANANKINQIEAEDRNMKNPIKFLAKLYEEIDILKETVQKQQDKISKLEAKTNMAAGEISFSVVTGNDHELSLNEKVKFDTVLSNIGDSYDANNWEFICPTSGIYIFTVTVRSYDSREETADVGIFINGNNNVIAAAKGSYDQGTNTVITQCGEEQVVHVKCTYEPCTIVGGKYSSFSGALLALV